jgi:hypothetical protein
MVPILRQCVDQIKIMDEMALTDSQVLHRIQELAAWAFIE